MKSTPITKLRTLTSTLRGPRHKDGEEWIPLKGIAAIRRGSNKRINIDQIGKGNTLIDDEGHAYDTFEFLDEVDLCDMIYSQLKANGW